MPLLRPSRTALVLWLTNAQQVRELDPETAGKNLPVLMSGVVTYYDGPLFQSVFPGRHGRDFCPGRTQYQLTNIVAGDEIEVQGVSDKRGLRAHRQSVRNHGVVEHRAVCFAAPRPVTIDQLFTGTNDSQWIEVRGVVRSTTILDGRHYLNLAMNGQRIMTYVKDLNEADARNLINTTVRLQGVCYSRYNMRRQLRVPWLAVSSLANVVVEHPPPGEPKDVSIASLAQFNSDGYYGNLVMVKGVVTLQKPDGPLFVQNGGYGLCVQLAQSRPARSRRRGDGFPGYSALGQYVPFLEDAMVQLTGHDQPPFPIESVLETLLKKLQMILKACWSS